MSGILNRLKGDRSLFAKLQETYPTEIVAPYGEVMVIPAKAFKNEWKEKLEAEGVKTYVTSHAGQACFFLRKVEQRKQSQDPSAIEEPSEAKSEEKPIKTGFWTPEERTALKELYSQEVSLEEISKKLGRSVFSVGAEIRYLPELKRKHAKKPKEKLEETKPKTEDPDLVKEFLSACSLLYPSHPKACAFLLKEASNKILEKQE